MNSKEALKNIKTLSYCKQHITIQEWCNIIEQDLDRLEVLQKIFNKLQERGIVYKRVQSLRETANPLYEVTIGLTQKEVETLRSIRK